MKIPKSVLSIGCFVIGGIFTTLAAYIDMKDTMETAKELAEESIEDDEDEEEEE